MQLAALVCAAPIPRLYSTHTQSEGERERDSTRVRGNKSQLRGEEEKELGRRLQKNMDEAGKRLCKKAQEVETLVILHEV